MGQKTEPSQPILGQDMEYTHLQREDERNRLQLLLDLYRRADIRIDEIEAFVIEECVRISASPFCFFGFINREMTEMRTHMWSNKAMEMCAIDFRPSLFPLKDAGIWAEAIRTRKPMLLNDYSMENPHKKGYPKGHVPIRRFLCIPTIKRDRVVAVTAVANKAAEYTQTDILRLSLFIESMWDILKRKEAEEKIRTLNKTLEQKVDERTKELMLAQEKLIRREKLSILGQLAGTVGHELRNPLGVMNNAIYFLNTVLSDADDITKEYLGIIQREIDTSLRIITDLLDFARTKTPRKEPVRVDGMIRQAMDRCTIPNEIHVSVQISEALPLINADPHQMGQVFQNLINNGVQAMPNGGHLSITALESEEKPNPPPPIDESPGRFVKLRVTDTGEGISPENMERLFQPLFTTKAKGVGLGLVVCKTIVENHGGEIGVETRGGEGTTFTIIIPIAEGRT